MFVSNFMVIHLIFTLKQKGQPAGGGTGKVVKIHRKDTALGKLKPWPAGDSRGKVRGLTK